MINGKWAACYRDQGMGHGTFAICAPWHTDQNPAILIVPDERTARKLAMTLNTFDEMFVACESYTNLLDLFRLMALDTSNKTWEDNINNYVKKISEWKYKIRNLIARVKLTR